MTPREGWSRWRAISDRIIAHPGYRYGDPRARLLLKLAAFAHLQMALFSALHWGVKPEPPWVVASNRRARFEAERAADAAFYHDGDVA